MTCDPHQSSVSPAHNASAAAPTDPPSLRPAIEKAVDYRGDVTLRLADGSSLEGYVYDARFDPPSPCLRMLPADGGPRRTVPLADVRALDFTGRDTAAGKSWEAWLKRYHEKKQLGESADLHPDPLD